MLFSFPRFATLVFSLLFTLSPIIQAQEAVETPTPREESTPEATPEAAKPAKRSGAVILKSLEETMRPEEFKAAGLDKLSEDELQHLDAYLQGYRQSTQKKASQQAKVEAEQEVKKANERADQAQKATEQVKREAASSNQKIDQLTSRVDGTIDGIKGHTQIRLEDGTVWKQANPDDHYRASVTDHPAAIVSHTWLGYKMHIEGMPEFYVDPVRPPQQ
ncbi:MAG TPA: hypothetical protein VFA58_00245 [Chthoniobacterales bacterium]|nr:hypothetical protein [Chthoniobacterales bacterium]